MSKLSSTNNPNASSDRKIKTKVTPTESGSLTRSFNNEKTVVKTISIEHDTTMCSSILFLHYNLYFYSLLSPSLMSTEITLPASESNVLKVTIAVGITSSHSEQRS